MLPGPAGPPQPPCVCDPRWYWQPHGGHLPQGRPGRDPLLQRPEAEPPPGGEARVRRPPGLGPAHRGQPHGGRGGGHGERGHGGLPGQGPQALHRQGEDPSREGGLVD